jgi:6-phosphogluconolactonase
MVKEFLFTDRDQLFTELTAHCHRYLTGALDSNNTAGLMVSGGSTPAPLFKALSVKKLDWPNIHIALVDERWVDKNHSASNEALIYKTLLINNAQQAPFTGMKNPAKTAAEGCLATEALYQQLPRPFTVTLLGMGSDGHTASLFPHADGLHAAISVDNKQLTTAVTAKQSEVTGPNTERLSLTLAGLLQSERLIVLLTGKEKLTVFRNAMQEGTVEDMPIRAILRQPQVPVELFWAP